MEEYASRPRTRKATLQPEVFALATITDGFLRLSFEKQIDRNLQEAYITSLKQSSTYLNDRSSNEINYWATKFTQHNKQQYNHNKYHHFKVTFKNTHNNEEHSKRQKYDYLQEIKSLVYI
jgi:transposase